MEHLLLTFCISHGFLATQEPSSLNAETLARSTMIRTGRDLGLRLGFSPFLLFLKFSLCLNLDIHMRPSPVAPSTNLISKLMQWSHYHSTRFCFHPGFLLLVSERDSGKEFDFEYDVVGLMAGERYRREDTRMVCSLISMDARM